MLSAALKYLAWGWSVFPVGRDKVPLLSTWMPYQERRPTEEEVKKWWGSDYPYAGIALVCGQVSGGIYVPDVDPRHGGDRSLEGFSLPAGPRSRTLHGGRHHFCRSDVPLATRHNILPGVDFQGEGSYVILPPSPGYTGLEEFGELPELPKLPQWVKDLVRVADSRPPKPKVPYVDIPLEQQARYLPEYNSAVLEKAGRKNIEVWVHAAWTEFRTLSIQVDNGSGFLDFELGLDFLRERDFRASRDFHMGAWDCLAWRILREGVGNHWERTPGGKLRLFSAEEVGRILGVNDLKTRRWHVVATSKLTTKREKLAWFHTIAGYDSVDRRDDPKFHPRARITIQRERSAVSPSTQLADDKVLGLVNGKRRKVGGKPTYEAKKGEDAGRPYLQTSSKHWSPARLGPHGRLRIIRKALTEGRKSETAYPPRYFDDDTQYQKAAERGPVADDPLVILPQGERRHYPPVQASVELWRKPVSV